MGLDEGQQRQGIGDVDEGEEAEGGVEEDAVERGSEAGPGEEDEGEEGVGGEVEFAGDAGECEGEEDRYGEDDPPERDVDGFFVGEGSVLVCGEAGAYGGEEG